MSESNNCKASGDFSIAENIAPVNLTPGEKFQESGDKSLTIENEKVQCLLDKVIQQESCPLIIDKNNEEQSAKKPEKVESCPLIINKNKDETFEKKTEEEECCPMKKVVNEERNTSDINSKLQLDIQEITKERDNYHKQLMETEKKFVALGTAFNALSNGKGDESSLRQEVENLKTSMAQTQLKLEDRIRVVANQENQINALMSQVSSLKDVVNITKDLLNIRNMEVKHLQDSVDGMEEKINLEREKHSTMLIKMESAFKINLDLKKEYETQLRLFQELREKYDKKVALLTEENGNLKDNDKMNKTI